MCLEGWNKVWFGVLGIYLNICLLFCCVDKKFFWVFRNYNVYGNVINYSYGFRNVKKLL